MPSPNIKTTKIGDATQDQRLVDVLNTIWDEIEALRKMFGDDGSGTKGALTGTLVKDYASIAAGAQDITGVVTVTGAALGDMVDGISCSLDLQGMQLTGYVSSANNVTLVMRNGTGGAIDLASATFRVSVAPKVAVDGGNLAAMVLSK